VPTVEAVEATIRKMTAMAERRSGDVDVLEVQMRKLGLAGGGRGGGSSSGSPSTPTGKGRSFGLGGGGDAEDGGYERERSVGEKAERARRLVDLRARRRAVLGRLREGLEKRSAELEGATAVAV
jgi:nucleoporin NUP159